MIAVALPPPCLVCRPQGGLWVESPDGGLCRCSCARGQALSMGLPAWRREQKKNLRKQERAAKVVDIRAVAARNTA